MNEEAKLWEMREANGGSVGVEGKRAEVDGGGMHGMAGQQAIGDTR